MAFIKKSITKRPHNSIAGSLYRTRLYNARMQALKVVNEKLTLNTIHDKMVTLRELLLQLAQNTEFQRFIKEMQDSNMSHADMVRVIASFFGAARS